MKVLFDTCVPLPLRRQLPQVEIATTQSLGWDSLKNGDLINIAEPQFDVLVTADQNLKYQQNLKGRTLAIVVLPTNHLPTVLQLAPKIALALTNIQPGDFVEVSL